MANQLINHILKLNLMIKKHWQILFAALLFLFSSCDQLLPPSGNGADIPVKIRAVSIAGGAKNETITRASAGEGKTIASATDNAISMNAPSSGNFNLAEGNFSGSASISFSGWSAVGERTVTSGEITFLPKATESYIIYFATNAVKVSGSSASEGRVTTPNSKFTAGCSYIIRLKIVAVTLSMRYADSNIYWDGSNSKLTFMPCSETPGSYSNEK
jgi:hypothetical protein